MIRVATIGLYAMLIALGMALLARPAVLWADGIGLSGPIHPGHLPLGWTAALLVCAFLVLTLVVSLRVAARRALRRDHHVALLLLVGLALAARAALPLDGVLPVTTAAAGATRAAGDPLLPDYPRTLARYPGSSRRARSSR